MHPETIEYRMVKDLHVESIGILWVVVLFSHFWPQNNQKK